MARAGTSATAVGAFVVGALILGSGLVLATGALHPFEQRASLRAFFEESVSGLEPGSPVKLRGVALGSVASIDVICSLDRRETAVVVLCELQARAVMNDTGEVLDFARESTVQRLVEKGMRATLGLEGITGARFVALDFYDPARHPGTIPRWAESDDVPAVPVVPSPISKITESLPALVGQLSDLEIGELTRETRALLKTLHEDARALNVEKLASSIEEATSSLDVVLQKSTAVLEDAHRLLDPRGGLVGEAARVLEGLAEAAGAFRRFLEFLQRNPDALVTGRRVPVSR